MVKIAGRSKEISLLAGLLDKTDPQLLAVYGRRRIGKTYLISQFFADQDVYFELTGSDKLKPSEQIINFTAAINETFPASELYDVPKNWTEAFHQLRAELEKTSTDKKVILFFDELPWLAKYNSGFLAALEFFWNRYMSRRPNVIIIICGSAAAWMIKHVISDKGGLYGRVTKKIHLQPFNLKEVAEYLSEKNINLVYKEIAELYMVLGGVAKYWTYVEQGRSAAQIINDICFDANGDLHNEFTLLYRSLFSNYAQHIKIIRALAKSSAGLSKAELLDKVKLSSGGGSSKIIEELVQSDFINYMVPFGKKRSKGKYLLIDEYSLFYLRWIEPITMQGAAKCDAHYWLKQRGSSTWSSWVGYAFEAVCQKHIAQIKKALGISAVSTLDSYWRFIPKAKQTTRGAQIDLVIDRADACINLCEIKFTQQPYQIDKNYAEQLARKKAVFQEQTQSRKTLLTTIISSYGVNKNDYYRQVVDGGQITLEELFS